MKIYIAGKISGITKEQYTANFKSAEIQLRASGRIPVNPCDFGIPDIATSEFALKICLPILKQCSHIYLLDNWNDSPGAVIERQFAIDNGIEVTYQNRQTAIIL